MPFVQVLISLHLLPSRNCPLLRSVCLALTVYPPPVVSRRVLPLLRLVAIATFVLPYLPFFFLFFCSFNKAAGGGDPSW